MKPEAATKVRARLIVLGFSCSPKDITKILGIDPTKSWMVGDRVLPVAKNVHHENGWSVDSPVDREHTTPEVAVQALLRLFPDRNAFRRLPKDAEVQLTISVMGYTERPSVFLSRESIEALAEICASLDVDPYDLTDT
jgi:hypothetical protein